MYIGSVLKRDVRSGVPSVIANPPMNETHLITIRIAKICVVIFFTIMQTEAGSLSTTPFEDHTAVRALSTALVYGSAKPSLPCPQSLAPFQTAYGCERAASDDLQHPVTRLWTTISDLVGGSFGHSLFEKQSFKKDHSFSKSQIFSCPCVSHLSVFPQNVVRKSFKLSSSDKLLGVMISCF
jgi:hypothetical protein